MQLRRLGSNYRGFDYDGTPIVAAPGDVFECSDARGERLLADYPGSFEKVGAVTAGAAPVADNPQGSAPTLSQRRKRRK